MCNKMKTLDPRKFEIRPSSLDEESVEMIINLNYQAMYNIGAELGCLRVIPTEREPRFFGRIATTGNYSMRIKNGFLITGSGVDKEHLNESDLIFVEKIDYEKGILFASGNTRPSRETLIHDHIYNAFPDMHCVLHTHDNIALNYNPDNLTQDPIFFATAEEAREVVDKLKEEKYVTLRKHGQFVAGKTIEEALSLMKQHHKIAVGARRNTRIGLRYLAAAYSAVLLFGYGIERLQWKDCNVEDCLDGIVMYSCSEKKDIKLKPWEGEAERINPDGTYKYILWVGGN